MRKTTSGRRPVKAITSCRYATDHPEEGQPKGIHGLEAVFAMFDPTVEFNSTDDLRSAGLKDRKTSMDIGASMLSRLWDLESVAITTDKAEAKALRAAWTSRLGKSVVKAVVPKPKSAWKPTFAIMVALADEYFVSQGMYTGITTSGGNSDVDSEWDDSSEEE